MSLDAPTEAPSAVAATPLVLARKVTAPWVGFLMIAGGLVTAVGSFLPFEKIVAFAEGGVYGTYQVTGIGSSTTTGDAIGNFTAGTGGKILLAAGLAVLVLGVLVVKGIGRLWIGIVSLIGSLVALLVGVSSLSGPKSDQKDLNATAPDGVYFHALGKVGETVATTGAVIAVLAGILALVVRRRRSA
jgi:hypothetical protein